MTTAKEIVAKMQAQAEARFASVMIRIEAIQVRENLDDQLSTDIENLTPAQQAKADEAIAAKAKQLGLA